MWGPIEIWQRIFAEAAPEGKAITATKEGQVEERPIDELWVEDFLHYRTDIQKGCLYSMLDIGPGDEQTEYTLFGYGLCNKERFSSPRGRLVEESRYSIAETNLYEAFELPSPESFLIQDIGIVFSPSVNSELRNRFCEEHGATLWIGGKWYQRYPLAGMFSVSDKPALSALQGFLPIGKVPLHIMSRVFFKMTIEASKTFILTDRIRLWGVLRGLRARGIQ